MDNGSLDCWGYCYVYTLSNDRNVVSMIVSPDILRRETISLMTQLDDLIREVKKAAFEKDIPPEQLRDDQGNWVMIPLLAAKVNAISTLAQLNQPRDRKETNASRR